MARSKMSRYYESGFLIAELIEDGLDPFGICKERVHATRIEMATALSFQEFDAFLERPRFFVGPFRNERIEYVGDRNYASDQRNVFGVQAVRIA